MDRLTGTDERTKRLKKRVVFIFAALLTMYIIVAIRAYDLQILKGEQYKRRAESQQSAIITLTPRRGTIFDRNGNVMAISIAVKSIFAEPRHIEEPEKTAQLISRLLDMDARSVLKKLKNKRNFVWIKRTVSPEKAGEIESLHLKGIGIVEEPKRFYPNISMAAQVIGFSGSDGKGLEGLEYQYDRFLRSEPIQCVVRRDAFGRFLFAENIVGRSDESVNRLYLTIDKAIQFVAERELEKAVDKFRAKGGFVVVADPTTMEILAMANYPNYNPNLFWKYKPERWRNRAIADIYEPGSTFKVFSAAAALEWGLLKPDTVIFCENGKYRYHGEIVHDLRPFKWLSLGGVIKYSSNIGAIKIAQLLGGKRFYKFTRALGFGEKTGIDLPGEAKGIVYPLRDWSGMLLGTVSFGQGIGVTGIQLITALSAIANGGLLMKPYVVKKIEDAQGNIIYSNSPTVRKKVMSFETAKLINSLMENAVSPDGTGHRAAINGYSVAGKTGTAQKIDPATRMYSEDKVIASFMGFVPAEEPKLAILVVVDEPKTKIYGGIVAAPLFKSIAEECLRYLGIVPKARKKEMASRSIRNWKISSNESMEAGKS